MAYILKEIFKRDVFIYHKLYIYNYIYNCYSPHATRLISMEIITVDSFFIALYNLNFIFHPAKFLGNLILNRTRLA